MRIACLQFNPRVGDVDNNLTRADRVLTKANPENLDLIVLPEMAFTGYNFKSLAEIHPSLEPTASGISSLWARTTALKHNCHVVVGYPEKADVSHKWPADPEYYNALSVVGPDGDDAAHYRKKQLYYTDETWALEGNKGFYGDHITGLGQTAIGICMDINPYKFETPWEKFEFAYHVLDSDANLVIVSMAWLTHDDPREFSVHPLEPDLSTLTYWAMRLEPVIRAESKDEIIVVFCNRCGTEGDALYAGTSAVVGIKDGEVSVYGLLGRDEKKLLVVDTNLPPVAKLVMTGQGMRIVPEGEGGGGGTSTQQTIPSQSSSRSRGEGDQGPRGGSCEEPRDRGSTTPSRSKEAARESRDRGSTPSRSREARGGKEAGPPLAAYDSPRQALPRLTPIVATASSLRNSPSVTPDTPLSRRNLNPPKLTIPDSVSHAWRKSSDTSAATDSVGTPLRKKARDMPGPDPHAPSRPTSRVPDSAVVLSAVDRHHRHGVLSPDSGIGRVTPETRPRKASSRRSGEQQHRSEQHHHSSRQREALRLETTLPEEDTQLHPLEEAILRAQTLKDSPVATRPDSIVLSHWLDTLPRAAELESAMVAEQAGARPPSTRVARAEEVAAGWSGHACHACGQAVPAKSGADGACDEGAAKGQASARKGLRPDPGDGSGLGSGAWRSPVAWEDGALSGQNSLRDAVESTSRSANGQLRPGVLRGDAAPRQEEKEREEYRGEDVLRRTGASQKAGQSHETEGEKEDIKILLELQPEADAPSHESEVDRAVVCNGAGESPRPLPEDDGPEQTLPAAAAIAPATPTMLDASELGTKGMRGITTPAGVRDPLAPRMGIVPPSVKGMGRTVVVALRPNSVAW